MRGRAADAIEQLAAVEVMDLVFILLLASSVGSMTNRYRLELWILGMFSISNSRSLEEKLTCPCDSLGSEFNYLRC